MNEDLKIKIAKNVKSVAEKYWKIRCEIHSEPELSFEEEKTSKKVKDILKLLNINFEDRWAGTGIVAEIEGGGKNGNTIALRSELDALPIEEQNKVDYVSKNKGVMHACGHDFHTASLLAAAEVLQNLKDEWKGKVKFIFQPGEEKLPGGASLLIKEGLLKKHPVDFMIAQHVTPQIDCGKAGFRRGNFMASTDELYITVKGKGGHAAMPDFYKNPILCLSKIISEIESEYVYDKSALIPTVVAIGKVQATGATNVIPEEAKAEGTIRTFDEQHRKIIHQHLENICNKWAKNYQMEVECNILHGYPVLKNDEYFTSQIAENAKDFLGNENVIMLDLRMTAEDFAYFSHEVPVCFYRLGTGEENGKYRYNVHHPQFDAGIKSFTKGIELMVSNAIFALSLPKRQEN